MTQPQPDECSTCNGYDSSTCPICRGTGEQPDPPLDLDTIQQDARLITAIQHEADTTPATYQANHQLHSPRLLAAGHRLIARVRELEQQLAAHQNANEQLADLLRTGQLWRGDQLISENRYSAYEIRNAMGWQDPTRADAPDQVIHGCYECDDFDPAACLVTPAARARDGR